jgi:hypothetical protein
MRWIAAVLTICLWASTPAFSAVSSIVTHTFQSAAAATGVGTSLDVTKYNSLSVQIKSTSGTFTVSFEGTIDNTNWVALTGTSIGNTSGTLVTSATAAGVYQFNTSGLASVRMNLSACGTCVGVTVTGVLTTAVASKKGGAGGGAPADATYLVTAADGTLSAEVTITPTDDNTIVANGTTWEIKALPSCSNATTSKLLYNITTNAWSCGTDQTGGVTVGSAVSGTANNGLLYSGATGNVTELDCANGEVPTQSAGAWTCGTIDAANPALSNLVSVALNTALLPDAAAADDFGSATLPFKDIFLAGSSGTPGTNNFKITGASTSGTRVITLPNATATLAGTTVALGGTGATSFTGSRCVQTNAGGTALESAAAACGSGGTNTFVIAFNTGSSGTYSLAGANPVDSQNYWIGVSDWIENNNGADLTVCIPVPVTSTLTAVYWHIRVNGATGTTEDVTHIVRNATAATQSTGVAIDWDAANKNGSETGLSLAFTAGDCLVGKAVTPAWATNPTNVKVHGTAYFTVP